MNISVINKIFEAIEAKCSEKNLEIDQYKPYLWTRDLNAKVALGYEPTEHEKRRMGNTLHFLCDAVGVNYWALIEKLIV